MTLWETITFPFRSGPRRRLVDRRPSVPRREAGVPLGMEATDLASVARVNRQNDALERVTGARNMRIASEHAADHVQPLPEDETYAARYHSAFQQKGS